MNPLVEQGRLRSGEFGTTDADGFNGAFRLNINGELLRVIASDGAGWQHVSVSKDGNPNRVPNWEHMCRVKELFFGEDVWVMQFHPAKADYVNNHPGCLHLWRPTEAVMPTPPSILTGYKDKSYEEVKAMDKRGLRGILLVDADPSGHGGTCLHL